MKNNAKPQDANPHHQPWHDRWQEGRIGFHLASAHPDLVQFWPQLGLADTATVFVPLCGKALDMIWLVRQGHKVIGVELSPIAAREFFTDNALDYTVKEGGKFRKYQGDNITILVGDFFDLTSADLPNVKAVYDRAALIALPEPLRKTYTQHLKALLPNDTQILLITLAYNQAEMDGPPFSVTEEEVSDRFSDWCQISTIATSPPEDFRGIAAFESVYKLKTL